MKINLIKISIRDLTDGFVDKQADGVFAYGGKLSIRPAYQREYVYKDAQRNAVMNTVQKGFPLNVMYWVKQPDGNFEVLDGQQRSISICDYVTNNYSIDELYFHNLPADKQQAILDYELTVYQCEGTDSEKLDWFRTINIAGEKLLEQELRNAVYTGPWLASAKNYFSRQGCPAQSIGADLLSGSSIRQEYLETALEWIAARDGLTLEGYMAKHQLDPNANALTTYFNAVIDWASKTFPKYRKEMKGVSWGTLYNKHHADLLDTNVLEAEVSRLMMDDDVTKKSGIYPYVLSDKTSADERLLSLRTFTSNQKTEAYTQQSGVCPVCEAKKNPGDPAHTWDISEMEADHIVPWSKGGRTDKANCQMLCRQHNREKGGK